ncbi:helix-turn-helix domain-containing protein [Pigmentiphaga litoralis]|uniref:helix-turn-helix domain-containing protein n=1 Tax=Pigmentiphaga litoralis TaxID=516702 RepID=UPI003B435610
MVRKTAPPWAETPSRQTLADRLQVNSWRFKNELFEVHSGRPITLHKHMHDDFQIAVNTRGPGRYVCDGKRWDALPGDIVAVHPGEVHSTVGDCERPGNEPALLLYISESRLRSVASGLAGRPPSAIGFGQRVFRDAQLAMQLTRAHTKSAECESELAKDSWILQTISALLLRHAFDPRHLPERLPQEKKRAERARDFISDHYADNISLDRLADIVQLSPFQLCRVFSREYGLAPHSYQTAMRVDRAKVLLASGTAPADAAAATGFYDQSHLNRHFRRIVGVTPGRYAAAR